MRRFAVVISFLLVFTPLLALLPGSASAQESTVNPGVTGNAYKSPSYGYKFAWDDNWSVISASSTPGSDLVGLSNGSSQVIVAGSAYSGGLKACPADVEHAQLANDPHLSNIQPLLGTDGKPAAGATATIAYATYTDTLAAADGSTIDLVDRFECRWIVTGASVLIIDEEMRQDSTADQEPLIQAVMSTLTIPAPHHKKSHPKPAAATPPAASGAPTTADLAYLKSLAAQPAGTVKLSLDLYDTLMKNPRPSDNFWLNRLSYVFTGWVITGLDSGKGPAVPARYAKLHKAYLAAIAPLVDATTHMTNAEDYVAGTVNFIDLSGIDYDALAKAVATSRGKFDAYDKLLNAARKEAGLPPL